jgi:4-amino-4-deoxy-L-arabinose transferase-like glycosyltransferase
VRTAEAPTPERRARPTPSSAEGRLFLALLLFGTVLGLLLTRHGVNTTDDADTYIGVARNLADGHGLTVPFTNVLDPFSPSTAVGFHGEVPFLLFGPLLSLVLAPFEWLGLASIDVVRYLNPLLLGFTLAVLGVLAWRLTRRSLLLSLAVVLLSLHTYVLQLYGFVQSEALFLPLALAALLFLGRWAASRRTRHLVAFTSFAALASLARMVGVSLALVGVIAVLVWSADRWSRRLGRALAVGAGAVGPLLVFVVYESALAGAGNRRPLSFQLPGTYDLRPTLDSLTRWLLPSDPSGALTSTHRWVVGALLLAIVLLLAGLAWRAWPRSPATGGPAPPQPADDVEARRLLGVVAMATAAYLLVLVASRTVTDHSAAFQFGGRLLVPALPLAWLLVAGVVAQWAKRVWTPRLAHTIVVTAGVLGLVLGVAHLTRTGEVLGWDGPGVNPTVAQSPTPEIVSRLAGNGVVFANAPNRIWNGTGLHAVTVPARTVALSGDHNQHLARDIAQLREELRRHGGVVVYLDGNLLTTLHLVPEDELVRRAGLHEVERTRDARIYALAP